MRLFTVLRNILKLMGRQEMYVFLEGKYPYDPEWLPVGPDEDPHTYPTLEQLAFYQGGHISRNDLRVYLLFPVPTEVLQPILEEHKEDGDPADLSCFGKWVDGNGERIS